LLKNYHAQERYFPVQDRLGEHNSLHEITAALHKHYASHKVRMAESIANVPITECSVVIEEPAFAIEFTMERMFYHFSMSLLMVLLVSTVHSLICMHVCGSQ
jgi:hypothetical protein